MRRHTEIGERIMSAAPCLAQSAELVRSSHERYDRYGCPDRLAGEEIPLRARVIAACDSFDAMTSERPYSAPVSVRALARDARSGRRATARLHARLLALLSQLASQLVEDEHVGVDGVVGVAH